MLDALGVCQGCRLRAILKAIGQQNNIFFTLKLTISEIQ